jgi:hypothetical protein
MHRRLTRGLLSIGVGVVVLNGFFLLALYGPLAQSVGPGPMAAGTPGPFPILLVPILAFAGSLFGLWRMWAASRGPR